MTVAAASVVLAIFALPREAAVPLGAPGTAPGAAE
jgi:hypothetical protein